MALDGVAQGARQGTTLDLTLDEVVLRAFLHRLGRQCLIIQARQHDDRDVRGCCLRAAHRIQAMPIRQALLSSRILLLAAVCFLNYFAYYSFLFWLPTMFKRQSGFSDLNVGLLGALPYAALFVAMLVNGWHSDRQCERRWHCAIPSFIAAAALLGLAAHPQSILVLLSLFTLATIGNAYLPALWAMPTELLCKSAAAASVGMINAVGSIAGFAGPYVFGFMNTKFGSFSYGLTVLALSSLAAGLLVLRIPHKTPAA